MHGNKGLKELTHRISKKGTTKLNLVWSSYYEARDFQAFHFLSMTYNFVIYWWKTSK